MNKISTIDARAAFSEIINRASFGKERIILCRRNKALAGIVPMEDLLLLETLEDFIDVKASEKALIEGKKLGTTGLKELKKTIGTINRAGKAFDIAYQFPK